MGAIAVDGYNPIQQTISNLAINQKAWIQDIGLNLFAVSFAAYGADECFLSLIVIAWTAQASILLLKESGKER